MRRREFITLLGGAAMWPLTARAQQPATPIIGFMSARSPDDSTHLMAAFHQGLTEGGFVEGQNVVIEFRWARGEYDRLPGMAADLVSRQVKVLVAVGGEPSALAAKRATSTIPIVFGIGSDPVFAGLVDSVNRPGANVTGATLLTTLMEPKRFGLLRELSPGVALVGVLLNPNFPPAAHQLQALEEAARSINQGLVVRGLLSYGPSITDVYRQYGVYTAKILNGAKPAELPIWQPTRFELVINLQTARSLGINISDNLLSLADEIIE